MESKRGSGWWTLVSLCVVIAVSDKAVVAVPPALSVDGQYMTNGRDQAEKEAGDDIVIKCSHESKNVIIKDPIHNSIRKWREVEIKLNNAQYTDTGEYSCWAEDEPNLVAMVYLFVKDVNNLLLPTSGENLPLNPDGDTIVPCRVSTPDATVHLYQGEHSLLQLFGEGGTLEFISTPLDVPYDPRKGFILSNPMMLDLACLATLGDYKNFDVFIKPREITVGNVLVSGTRYVSTGGTIMLQCTIEHEPNDAAKFPKEWILPEDSAAKEEGRFRQVDLQPMELTKTIFNLTIFNAKKGDIGEYTCSAGSSENLHTDRHQVELLDDYSESTWPYMVLRVAHLEMERKELVYEDKVIPKRKGLIELECNVASTSLLSSLGPELEKEVAGIEWDLPNNKIIEEKRAFIKELGSQEVKLQSLLVITDFNEDLDAGAYRCGLSFKHEYITRYQQQIFIPSLNGAPIMKCQLECQRNKDEACQIMGEYRIDCQTYSNSRTQLQCDFQECDTEEACLPTPIKPPFPVLPGDFYNRPTPMYNHEKERVTGGLATRSGAFSCEAVSDEGVAALRLYMPVSLNEEKKPGPVLMIKPPPGVPVFEPPKPDQVSGKYSYWKKDWYGTDKIYEFGCWTSKDVEPFQWNFRSIKNREWSQTLTDNTLPYISISNYESLGGRASMLHVTGATEEHGGFYFCSASNGTDIVAHKEFELSAAIWKDDANVNSDAPIVRQVGSSVTLRCTMRTTGSHIVTWEKVDLERGYGGNIGPEPNIELSHDYEVLTIHNLTERDSGLYKCSDSFDVNSMQGKVTLNVVDHPFDQYEKIEELQQAVKALREAEGEISDIVRSIAPQPPGERDEDDDDSAEKDKEDSSEEEID